MQRSNALNRPPQNEFCEIGGRGRKSAAAVLLAVDSIQLRFFRTAVLKEALISLRHRFDRDRLYGYRRKFFGVLNRNL